MNTEIILHEPQGVALTSLDEMRSFAEIVVKSKLAPKGFETPESVIIALQMGAEVGLAPMAALQNIGVINGKPCLYGDAPIAIIRASGLLEAFEERIERGATEEDTAAFCKVQRKGYAPHEQKFSVAMSKKAGLWGKAGPWTQYPQRMLQMRARSFALRDQFADILKGFKIAEEVGDYSPIIKQATIRETTPLVLPDEPEQITIAETAEVAQ
jgi:hypothetical protein